MPDRISELHRVSWPDALPFVRLFRASRRALSFGPLVLGLACVTSAYLAGRVLDLVWTSSGAGVYVAGDDAAMRGSSSGALLAVHRTDEIALYSVLDSTRFREWRRSAAESADAAARDLAARRTTEHRSQVTAMQAFVRDRLALGLSAVAANSEWSAEKKALERARLLEAADVVRFSLAGKPPHAISSLNSARAADALVNGDPSIAPAQRAEELSRLAQLLRTCDDIRRLEAVAPRGPFAALLDYELSCLAAAVRGVCSVRLGVTGGAFSSEPALLGSVGSAVQGVAWLVTQRPLFAILCGAIHLLLVAFFGGAICRIAAVESAREKTISLKSAVAFAREKLPALVSGPLLLPGVFILVSVVMLLVGLVAGILGGLGSFLSGLLFFLALVGGVALAFALIGTICGLHLMWPTVAVEGSDGFDAVQRGAGYVFQRPWNVAFYTLVLLVFAAPLFVVLRALALLLLKLTHVVADAGMSAFGGFSSRLTSTVSPLSAMWHMPDWQDLPLLPTVSGMPLWGEFAFAPLSALESAGSFLIAVWVFLVVGALAGAAVSFFFCGSTEMYTLVRRDVDGVDYDEIYYEDEDDAAEDEAGSNQPAPDGAEPAGTPLPVISSPAAGGA